MKGCLFFASVCLAIVAAQIPPEQLTALMRLHNECQRETGLSNGVAAGAITGSFPNDPVLKSHLLCIGKKMGTINSDGSINREAAQNLLGSAVRNPERARTILDTCAHEQATPEDTAYEVAKCLYSQAH